MTEEETFIQAQEQFEPMFKIARYYREVVCSEKLDGTSGAIVINENGVFAGSKNRLLKPGKSTDNFGFAAWVESCKDDLYDTLGIGTHRGEWMGVGIQRGYGLVERRFYLFNTAKWAPKGQASLVIKEGEDNTFNTYVKDPDPQLPKNVYCVPVLYEGPHDQGEIDAVLTRLRVEGSVASPGFMEPEGIVVFHQASRHLYKITCSNDSEWKGGKRDKDGNAVGNVV